MLRTPRARPDCIPNVIRNVGLIGHLTGPTQGELLALVRSMQLNEETFPQSIGNDHPLPKQNDAVLC